MSEIVLPFSGFYNSLWASGIEHAEELLVEHLLEERDLDDDLRPEITELFSSHTNYVEVYNTVAAHYAVGFSAWLNDEFSLDACLCYKLLQSPREYNFTTDRIFCEISQHDAQQLLGAVDTDSLSEAAKERFTSRSGFISFYSPDVDAWGPLETWGHNQLGTILHALVGKDEYDFEPGIYEDVDFYSAFDAAVDWPALEQALDELLLVEAGEIEPDARKFPPGTLTVPDYVARYIQLNNLKG